MSQKRILTNLNLSNNLITNLAPPINQLDGVNKDFIDEILLDNFNISTYLLSNQTVVSPNSGEIRLNNATLNLSSEMYIHVTDSNSFDISSTIDNLTINSNFIIRQVSDSSKWISFKVGSIVNNTTYFTVDIIYDNTSVGGSPLVSEICKIEFSSNIENNIYTTDGTLEGDRKVIMHGASASNTFSFRDSADSYDILSIRGDGNINITEGNAYLYGGENALKLATKGDTNSLTSVILGVGAGDNITDNTTYRQTAMGYWAGQNNTGTYQSVIGFLSGWNNTGIEQTAIGGLSGRDNTGDKQTAIGYSSGRGNIGINQVAIGVFAGFDNIGSNNISIGRSAGFQNQGDNCIFIGTSSGVNNTINNISIIGNNDITDAYIKGGLHLQANGALSSDLGMVIRNSTDTDDLFKVQGDGNVGVGIDSPNSRLDILSPGNTSSDLSFRIQSDDPLLPDLIKVQGDRIIHIEGTSPNNNVFFRDGRIVITQLNDLSTATNLTGNLQMLNTTPYIDRYTNTDIVSPQIRMRRARGTNDTPLSVEDGDILGNIFVQPFSGISGFGSTIGSAIAFIADGSFTDSSQPTSIILNTTPIGTRISIERVRIKPDGNVGIGTNVPSNTLDINGTLRVRTINNGIGNFITKDSNGVLTERTASEVYSDLEIEPAGINGEIQFNDGGNFGASQSLYWDNNNARMSIGQGSSPSARLDIGAQGTLATDKVLNVRNSADTDDLFTIQGDDVVYINGLMGIGMSPISGNRLTIKANTNNALFDVFTIRNNTDTSTIYKIDDLGNQFSNATSAFNGRYNFQFNGSTVGNLQARTGNVMRYGGAFNVVHSFNDNASDADFHFNIYNNKAIAAYDLGVGSRDTPVARLDVRAQGALSTDTVLRLRNSADTADLFKVSGDGSVGIGMTANTSKLDVNGIISSNIDNGEVRSYQLQNSAFYLSLKTDAPKSGLFRSNADFIVYYDTTNGNVVLNSTAGTSKAIINGKTQIDLDIDGSNIARVQSNGNVAIGSGGTAYKLGVTGSGSFSKNGGGDQIGAFLIEQNGTGGGASTSYYDGSGNLRALISSDSAFFRNVTGSIAPVTDGFRMYSADRGGVAGKASAHFVNEDGTTNVIGDLSGFRTAIPGATVDIHAHGALSTDKALNIRNSGDTADLFKVSGDGSMNANDLLIVNSDGDVYASGAQGNISNTFFGFNSGRNATGDDNIGFGNSSLESLTTGIRNVGVGVESLFALTTGGNNFGLGRRAGFQITNGSDNVIIGNSTNVSGNPSRNVAIGNIALFENGGLSNIAIGYSAGRFVGSGSTAMTGGSYNLYFGHDVRGSSTTPFNEVVIAGRDAIGNGSHTTTIGNDTTTDTYLRGGLHLQANGTLSTDLGMVIRNSGDTADLFKVSGDGSMNANDSLYVNSNGRVAIGLPTATRELHVYSPLNDLPFRLESGDAAVGIEFKDNTSIGNFVYTGSSNKFQLVGNLEVINDLDVLGGNITIGTTDPIINTTTNQIKIQANGANIFRGLAGWTGTWADGGTTTYFQTSTASGRNVFSALNGSLYSRLAFLANNTQYTNQAGNNIDPTEYFEIDYDAVKVFGVSTEGEVYTKVERWTIDLMNSLSTTIYASEAISITLVENIVNAPTTTITVNNVAYTLGDPISSGDEIGIVVDTASVIKLKIEK